jgi:hypothetical protein
MSLINDALKRARQSQRNDPPSGAPPLPPIEPPARGGTGWILVVAAVLFLAAACLFVGSTVFGHKSPPVAAAKSPVISALPRTETTPAPAPPRADAAPAPQSVTSALPPPVIHPNPPTAAVMDPLPKLQGIIFSATHPLAIVNGKTVSVGDQVGDFLVKQILKTSVVFQYPDGSQKTVDIGG